MDKDQKKFIKFLENYILKINKDQIISKSHIENLAMRLFSELDLIFYWGVIANGVCISRRKQDKGNPDLDEIFDLKKSIREHIKKIAKAKVILENKNTKLKHPDFRYDNSYKTIFSFLEFIGGMLPEDLPTKTNNYLKTYPPTTDYQLKDKINSIHIYALIINYEVLKEIVSTPSSKNKTKYTKCSKAIANYLDDIHLIHEKILNKKIIINQLTRKNSLQEEYSGTGLEFINYVSNYYDLQIPENSAYNSSHKRKRKIIRLKKSKKS